MNTSQYTEKAQKRIDVNRQRMEDEDAKVTAALAGQGIQLGTRIRCARAARQYFQNEINSLQIFLQVLFELAEDTEERAAEVEA